MYDIRILDGAAHELKRLDKAVGRRVVKRIRWLAENLDEIQPKGLTGNLGGRANFKAIRKFKIFGFLPVFRR